MRYAVSRYNQHQREHAYRIYVSDCLRIMTENTAKYAGGTHLTKRYADVIQRKPLDNRSGAEIAADIIQKAGLVVIR